MTALEDNWKRDRELFEEARRLRGRMADIEAERKALEAERMEHLNRMSREQDEAQFQRERAHYTGQLNDLQARRLWEQAKTDEGQRHDGQNWVGRFHELAGLYLFLVEDGAANA